MFRRVLAALVFTAILSAQWTEKERALGGQMALELEKEYKRFDAPLVGNYLQSLAARLSPFPIEVVVLDADETVRASFPGGRVYLSTALILAQPDESSLAVEIAHQIAHLSARHGWHRQKNPSAVIWWALLCTRRGNTSTVPLWLTEAAQAEEREAREAALRLATGAGYRTGDSQPEFNNVRDLLPRPKPRPKPTLRRAAEK